MEKELVAQILGWLATVVFTIQLIPQVVKTLKTKSVKDISFWFFGLYLIGNLIAITYATLIAQPALQIKYLLAIIVTTLYIIIYVKYKKTTTTVEGDITIK